MRVIIRFEEDGRAVEVTDVIPDESGAVEVLVSGAYALWNVTQREAAA